MGEYYEAAPMTDGYEATKGIAAQQQADWLAAIGECVRQAESATRVTPHDGVFAAGCVTARLVPSGHVRNLHPLQRGGVLERWSQPLGRCACVFEMVPRSRNVIRVDRYKRARQWAGGGRKVLPSARRSVHPHNIQCIREAP
jgi:hypothetical protein